MPQERGCRGKHSQKPVEKGNETITKRKQTSILDIFGRGRKKAKGSDVMETKANEVVETIICEASETYTTAESNEKCNSSPNVSIVETVAITTVK